MDKKETGKKSKGILSYLLKAIKSFSFTIPILIGTILLIGLLKSFVSFNTISKVFTGDVFRDTVIGSLIGSIFAGSALNSYVIGGELLKSKVSLFAVTSFLIAWVTVGIIQLPAEIAILGKRFAFARNLISFILSILLALAVVNTLRII